MTMFLFGPSPLKEFTVVPIKEAPAEMAAPVRATVIGSIDST